MIDSNGIVSITFRDETRAVCDDGWGIYLN